MSADRLDAIKAALAAGSEDEWWPLDEMCHLTPAQAAFYADAPETVEYLIAEVERLRAELAQAHHYRIEVQNPGIENDPTWIAHKAEAASARPHSETPK